jgi:hypothetical protein
MKKIVTLFIASAAAFSAFATPPETEGAERKKEACEWQGAPSIDSIAKQRYQQRQEQMLAQVQARAGADLLRQSVAPGDSAGRQQRHKQRQEQMQARKVGYFTTQLELTPEEAALFWPVYNEYWKKRDDLFNERNSLIRKAKRDKVDDKKALQIAQRMVDNLQDDANLTREYNEKFTKILSPQKLLKYYIAEESFKVELLNVLRKHGSKVEN